MDDLNFWNDLSEFFKIFGDGTRLRILNYLLDGEKCVSEIAESLEISTSAVSHQLKTLRTSNIVRTRKDGKQIYYTLSDKHIEIILKYAYEHIQEGVEK